MRRLIIQVIVGTLLLLPVISLVFWFLQEPKLLNVLILDKTVLTKACNEHRSFNWTMTHEKYYRPDGEPYAVTNDYLGFFPLENYRFYINDLKQKDTLYIDSLSRTLDMLYCTDTYGVYELEWKAQEESTEFSRLIYGGMDSKDEMLLEKVSNQDKLVIAEFNTIATPTPYRVRKKFEEKFELEWSGWTGRYFISLDTLKNREIPKWVINEYIEQYDTTWHFKNSGLVFVHVSEKIVICETGPDVLEVLPIITTPKKFVEKFGVEEFLRYPFWFDIISLPKGSPLEVISYYKLYTTERGDSILDYHEIPTTFPANVYLPGDNYRFFYFAGDFADNPISFGATYFRWIENLNMFMYNNQDWMDRRKFFWNYYQPMMSEILGSYYAEKRDSVQLYHQKQMVVRKF
jgi:hypothetical protein